MAETEKAGSQSPKPWEGGLVEVEPLHGETHSFSAATANGRLIKQTKGEMIKIARLFPGWNRS